MESIKDKLKKIKALADNGVSGEAENAKQILNDLLLKYNITIDELISTEKETYSFEFKNKSQKELLFQIYGKVTNKPRLSYYTYRTVKNCIGFDLTPMQYAEINLLYGVYSEALESEKKILSKRHKEERNLFTAAFIRKHNIYPDVESEQDQKEIDIEKILKVLRMSEDMEDVIIPRGMLAENY